MTFYVIIRGPLGIGKSTISLALAKKLNATYISFDKVLEENGLDKIDDDFTPEDFIKANEIVLPKIKKDLARGKVVILDGCFYFKEQINHLEENLPGKFYAFDLKASLDSCIKRDSKRKRVYGEEAARAVYNLVAKFDCGFPINTEGKTAEETIKEILEKIK
jgi:shikimate kinase